MARFMHVSDTHLGAVQYGIEERENDFYDAFSESINIAIDNDVDFIIHSGDLFDSSRPSNRALTVLKENMLKLYEKHIEMICIPGDHDRPRGRDITAHGIFDFVGLRMLGMDNLEFMRKEDVDIGGIGNMKLYQSDILKEIYAQANEKASHMKKCIFVSHQAIDPYFPEEQCEAKKSDLPVNFTYMAFGHVHQFREEKIGRSIFSYAGSTEVKATKEIPGLNRQGKGVNIVEIEDEAEVKRIRLKSTRMQYDLVGSAEEIFSKMDQVIKENHDKKPLLNITLTERIDNTYLKNKIRDYSDYFIIRTPRFELRESKGTVEVGSSRKQNELFVKYFESEGKGNIAYEIFKELRNGDFSEEEIRRLAREGSDAD
ncbi:metallophosphoesterase family protein [Cuniculiplasma sp. SKW3]|uniref:metallophosphoesterase family protein n=1 Tax=Cuniculiplasma sp. SKW3 TaxID=3400170 RepID=UPI003FCF09DB